MSGFVANGVASFKGYADSGDIVQILTVNVDPGYQGNPGHAGNGVVTTIQCPTEQTQSH